MRIFKYLKRKFFPRHLLGRFILIILLPMVILQAMIGIYFFNKHWDTISRRLANDVIGEIRLIAHWSEMQEDPSAKLDVFEKNLGLQLNWKADEKLSYDKTNERLSSAKLRNKIEDLPYPQTTYTNEKGEQEIDIQLSKGVLNIVVPRKRFFSTTVPSFLWWMLGSSVLLFTIAFLFMKNQVRAITRLAKAAELFGMGQEVRFKPEGAYEVRLAGLSFIEMKERIARYMSERTSMLAGVSHDLRTPLTRMKLELSMMEPDETTQMLHQDINEMESMLTGYLDFARGAGKEKMEEIDLDLFLTSLVEKYKRVGFGVSLHIEQTAKVMARPHELMRAFSNLISNAQNYATKTNVSMGIRDDMIQVTVDDNGPGIPAKKRDEVFKPFYRVEPSRNKNTGGVGLGMTIARDTILSHGGEIKLETSPMKGLRVLITLPIKNDIAQ